MSPVEISGMVVIGLTSVLVLFGIFVQLLIKPVAELTVSVTKLVAALDGVSINHGKLEIKVDKHDTRLDNVDIKLAMNNIR